LVLNSGRGCEKPLPEFFRIPAWFFSGMHFSQNLLMIRRLVWFFADAADRSDVHLKNIIFL